MRSRANFKSHPLHPILVAFPIAFFTATLIFDLMALIGGNERFSETARYLNIAGVVMAVAAAVPGLIDFLYTVPPRSSAKSRAATHGILNVCMLTLFIIVLISRPGEGVHTPALLIVLELIAIVLMLVAGWMGGTLVHRNQIGVDPRYAFAGKWKEAYLKPENGRVQVAAQDDLKRDQMKLLHVAGKRIVLARTEEGYVAFDDRCTHKGGSLAGGMMICGTVQCPWHGSQFDVVSGTVKAGPADEKINTYKIETIDGLLYLNLDR